MGRMQPGGFSSIGDIPYGHAAAAALPSRQVNPLLQLDWTKVRMLRFDAGVLTYRLEDDVVRSVEFSSKQELDAAFAEWVASYAERKPFGLTSRFRGISSVALASLGI